MSTKRPFAVRLIRAAAAALVAAFAGCGSEVTTVPVSGRITLDGHPLADAHVSFEPVHGDPTETCIGSYGRTRSDGGYTLRLVTTDQPGATPGTHLVRIRTARAEDPTREDSPLTPERVPVRYREGITFELAASGADSADFALTTQP